MIKIPLLNGIPEFSEDVILGSKLYTFKFKWNVRGSYWTFDLLNSDVPIVSGVKIVLSGNLTSHLRSVKIPGLGFMAVDKTGTGKPIGFLDLNKRILLGLLTGSDTVAANAAL